RSFSSLFTGAFAGALTATFAAALVAGLAAAFTGPLAGRAAGFGFFAVWPLLIAGLLPIGIGAQGPTEAALLGQKPRGNAPNRGIDFQRSTLKRRLTLFGGQDPCLIPLWLQLSRHPHTAIGTTKSSAPHGP